jgi:hypothetical protein
MTVGFTVALLIGGLARLICWSLLAHRWHVGVGDLWNNSSVSLAITQVHWSAV